MAQERQKRYIISSAVTVVSRVEMRYTRAMGMKQKSILNIIGAEGSMGSMLLITEPA